LDCWNTARYFPDGQGDFLFHWGEHARAVNGPLPSELVLKLRRRRTSLLSFEQNTGLITAIGRIETAPRGRRLVWPDKMCGFSQKAWKSPCFQWFYVNRAVCKPSILTRVFRMESR
jgi:hypothetical protein